MSYFKAFYVGVASICILCSKSLHRLVMFIEWLLAAIIFINKHFKSLCLEEDSGYFIYLSEEQNCFQTDEKKNLTSFSSETGTYELRMKKIKKGFKRQTWKQLAIIFKMHCLWLSSRMFPKGISLMVLHFPRNIYGLTLYLVQSQSMPGSSLQEQVCCACLAGDGILSLVTHAHSHARKSAKV